MSDDGHICGAVSAAQARLVLPEPDIENPVQAVLDTAVGSGGLSEGFGGQDARGDIASPFDPDLGARLDAGLDHGDGAQALEARFVGIAPSPLIQSTRCETRCRRVSMRPWPFSTSVSVSTSCSGAASK